MEKVVHSEPRVTPQHGINRTAQFLGQHGQRLARAVFFLQSSALLLACRMVPQQQDGGFRKGPLQVRVTALASRGAVAVTGGCLCTCAQAARGDKILHPRETLDVLHLVEQDEAQDVPDPGHGLEHGQSLGIVLLGRCDARQLHSAAQVIVGADQGEIHFQALLDCWSGEPRGDASAVGFVGQLFADLGPVLLALGVLDVRQEFRPCA